MTKCVFKLHKHLLIEGGSYVNVPKGDSITKVETTYLSLVLVLVHSVHGERWCVELSCSGVLFVYL